jgi:hypothetical protein
MMQVRERERWVLRDDWLGDYKEWFWSYWKTFMDYRVGLLRNNGKGGEEKEEDTS